MTIRGNHIASAIVLALGCSIAGVAQSTPAQLAHYYEIHVLLKADMVNEWINIEKNEVIPAQKKGGIKTRTTYQTVIGNTNEYRVVRPLEKYAELDGEPAVARALGAEKFALLQAKLAKCYEIREVFVITPQPELSTVTTAPAAPPPFGVFTRRRVAPGKLEEYQNFVKTQVLPVYKKAGAHVTVLRRGLGANSNDFTAVIWIDKLADIDAGNPITRVLGEAGAAKLAASGAPFSAIIETVVRRRVPELSY